MSELLQDPEFVARQKLLEDKRRRKVESYRKAARDVLADLAAAGFNVKAIGDLRRAGTPYREAIPVLMRWLPCVQGRSVKEDIVRTLSVPWAVDAATLLIAEFERADDATGLGFRWTIGNVLEVLANEDIADDLMRLATERRYGRAREMVVLGLGKLNSQRVTGVLLNLLTDDDVVGHAVKALGSLHAKAARSHIEALRNHPKPWIRREVVKALAKIDKAD